MKARRNRSYKNSKLPLQSLKARKRILKIVVKAVAVKEEPSKVGVVLCQIMENVFVQTLDEVEVESVIWFRIGCGWICSLDASGALTYTLSTDPEAAKSWAREHDNRRRIAASITAMLTRSNGLVNARRIGRSILAYSKRPESKNLLNLPDVTIEDLMIGLTSSVGLRQAEIFEFIRITASHQSNPLKAVEDISMEIDRLIQLRPSTWVKDDLNILETCGVREKNDKFVMAAARGDFHAFDACLAVGQELVALHSALGYTALHAAADFGSNGIVKRLLAFGVSANIRDTRKAQTALHFAAQSGRSEICQLLLENGADRTIPNAHGMLPYQLADAYGHFEAREILKHPPPEIHHVEIVETTPRSISISWIPPVIAESVYAKVLDYVVEWTPVGNPAEVGHGNQFNVSTTNFTKYDLIPYTGHSFCIYSRSLAGLSSPSSKIIPFTNRCEPDTPDPVEIFKITTNSLLIAWQPPLRENGAPIKQYQLEIIDCNLLDLALSSPEDDHGIPVERYDQRFTNSAYRPHRKEDGNGANGIGAASSSSSGEEDDEEDDVAVNTAHCEQRGDGNSCADSLKVELHGSVATEGSSFRGSMVDPGPSQNGGPNRWHRVIRHKNPHLRYREITGLQLKTKYRARIRCRSALGYSLWSEWCEPVAPKAGVYVLEKKEEGATSFLRLGWFAPMLSGKRKIGGYEIQMCFLEGPLHKSINVNMPVFLRKREPTEVSKLEFVTVVTCTANEAVIPNLRAGGNYLFRVRPEIDGEYVDWKLSVCSDVVAIPACAPEPPTDVHPVLSADLAKGDVVDDNAEGTLEEKQERNIASRGTERIFEVTHTSIVVSWTSGQANGSPVTEYQIEAAKIRNYNPSEMDGSLRATLSADEFSELESSRPNSSRVLKNANVKFDAPLMTVADPRPGGMRVYTPPLLWFDVTAAGTILGPTAFRANGLAPGSGYVFRVRQRNTLGWSDFSLASIPIYTDTTAPPGKPEVLSTQSHHVTLGWMPWEADDKSTVNVADPEKPILFELTILEYEMEIGQLNLQYSTTETPSSDNIFWQKTDFRNLDVHRPHSQTSSVSLLQEEGLEQLIGDAKPGEDIANDAIVDKIAGGLSEGREEVHVLLDKLTPNTTYVVRVRSRSVAGWSRWSKPSQPFRTIDSF